MQVPCVQSTTGSFGLPHWKKSIDQPERAQWRVTKIVREQRVCSSLSLQYKRFVVMLLPCFMCSLFFKEAFTELVR